MSESSQSYQNYIAINIFDRIIKAFETYKEAEGYISEFKSSHLPKIVPPKTHLLCAPIELWKPQSSSVFEKHINVIIDARHYYADLFSQQIEATAKYCELNKSNKAWHSLDEAANSRFILYQLIVLEGTLMYLYNTTCRGGIDTVFNDVTVGSVWMAANKMDELHNHSFSKHGIISFMMENCRELEGLSFPYRTPDGRRCKRSTRRAK